MSKIYFQGTFGAYSHLAALSIDPKAEILPCKTFDDCFTKASEEPESKIIIPTGQSGLPNSPHYQDQTPLYNNGLYRTTNFDPVFIKTSKKFRKLVLYPN